VIIKISKIKHWSLNAALDLLSVAYVKEGMKGKDDVYKAVIGFIKEYNKTDSSKS